MEITKQYIISQIFTIISYIFLALTYYSKNRKTVLVLNFISQMAFLMAYIFLRAWSGIAMIIVGLIRNMVFIIDEYKNGKRNKINKMDIVVLASIYIICIISAIFTYQGILSLLSILATMLYTYAICQKDIKTYKILNFPTEILWIFYNIYIKSILGIILEFIMLISCAIGYYMKANKE